MTIIAGYARTAFVKSNGQFATVPATVLGGVAVKGALEKAGITPAQVDIVVGGQVLQGGAGQNPARQAGVNAGLTLDVPAITLNAVCLSGAEAVVQGHRLISLGEADVVVALGMESMTLAPHAWVGSRAGKKFGAVTLIDTTEHDGLTDAFENIIMGASTDEFNSKLKIGREEQDRFSAASHQKLDAAIKAGVFDDEIVPVEVPARGGSVSVSVDDGLRADTTVETLAKLKPAFSPTGTITAGSASQISDGAAAVILVSEKFAKQHGITGLAEVVSHALVAGPDISLHSQPANAIAAALAKTDLTAKDLVAVEINEAFAAVVLHSTGQLGIEESIVNPNGGGIAQGHPIGASGARIVGHLARRLAKLGTGSVGAIGICGGGGQGSAVVLRAL